jgi:anti-sigma factor RsiW
MMDRRSKLPQRDLERLSAYIDGQLNDRQTQRLEARLRQEPELRRELESLRITVQSLRDLPAPRPTKHFTLTPEMAGQRQKRAPFPVLGFATALAGLAFIVLVGIEGIQSFSGSQLAARAPEMVQEVQVAEDAVTSDEEPMAAAPAEEPAAELEAMEMPAEESLEQEPEALMMEAPEAEEVPAMGEDQAQKVTGTPEPTEAAALAAGESAEGRSGLDTEAQAADQPVTGETLPETLPEEAPNAFYAQDEGRAASTKLSTLRWLQVIAGALFIILSVLTITFRSRST